MRNPELVRLVMAAFVLAGAPAALAGQAPPPQANAQAEPGQPPAHSLQIKGWARTSVETTVGDETDEDDARRVAVPQDVVLARELVSLRARYSRGRSFEAVGSALLTLELFQGAGFNQASGTERHDAGAEIREAYVGFPIKEIDIRAGLQRVAWGHGDIFSPNDIVNARDIRDPLLSETELRYVPTVAIRGDAELPGGSLRLVVQPIFSPDRYDVYGSNWALVQPGAPAGYRGLLGVLTAHPNLARGQAADAILDAPGRPPGLSGTQAGLRFDWHAGRFDVSHYYHYGFHGSPDFRVERFAVSALDAIDWTQLPPAEIETLASDLNAAGAVGAEWKRRQHFGLDIGTTAGPFVLRLDTAYQQPALFYDRTLNGWSSPAFEAAFGVEYQTGTLGRTILIEGRHRHIRDRLPEGGLLFVERDSVDLAVLARWTWNAIELETRAVGGQRPRTFGFKPQVSWKQAAFTLNAGVAILGGDTLSYGHWYRRNRSMYLMLRKDF